MGLSFYKYTILEINVETPQMALFGRVVRNFVVGTTVPRSHCVSRNTSTFNVCVVGSGPAGFYTAYKLLKVIDIYYLLYIYWRVNTTKEETMLHTPIIVKPLLTGVGYVGLRWGIYQLAITEA